MTKQTHSSRSGVQMLESVSALVDGEASELELRRVLNATETDPELRTRWARYHCVSTVMRGDIGTDFRIDLSAAIREAIDEEPAVVSAPVRSGWRMHLPRVGIAASVAAVMVLTAQVISFGGGDSLEGSLAATVEPAATLSSEEKLLQSAPLPSMPAGFQYSSPGARTVSTAPGGTLAYGGPYYQSGSRPVIVTTPVRPPAEVQAYLQKLMEMHAANAAAQQPVYDSAGSAQE